MNKKIFSFISVIFIGAGLIGMGTENVTKSETFSTFQVILGHIFMVIALYKIKLEKKKQPKI